MVEIGAPLTRAAEKSDKGKFYEQLAQSYLQDEEWAKAEAAMVKALDKGGLDDEPNGWLVLGIPARVSKNMTKPSKLSARPVTMTISPRTHFAGSALLNAAWRKNAVPKKRLRRPTGKSYFAPLCAHHGFEKTAYRVFQSSQYCGCASAALISACRSSAKCRAA